MGNYKLKIGTNEFLKEIKDHEDFRQTFVRDFREKIVRVRGDYKFTAYQGLYELLYTHLVTEGVCSALDAKVYYSGDSTNDYEYIFKGQIKPQDSEFDLINLSCDGQILEDVWAARFAQAEDQRIYLNSTRSKNNLSIVGCPKQDVYFYDPRDGSYEADTRITYKVYDVLAFLVRYYTDGEATFESTYFESGGDGDQYHITTGLELRTHSGQINPQISFSELFSELNKKFDLFIIIEGTNDAPVLRIERRSYSLVEYPVLDVNNPEQVTVKTDLDQLYPIVKVGSSQTDYNYDERASYPNRRFKSWNDEEYNTLGDCEFENNVLDLVSTYRIDSNSIEQALDFGGNDDETFDENIFLVEVDDNNYAIQFNDDTTQADTNITYFYNFNLTNEQVLSRWFDGIPAEIAESVEGQLAVFVNTVNQIGLTSKKNDVIFENDSTLPAYDPDDVYTTPSEDPANEGEFFIKNGSIYFINAFIKVGASTNPLVNFYSIYAVLYDVGGNVLLEQRISNWENGPTAFSYGVVGSGVIFIPDDTVLVIRCFTTKGGSFTYDITEGFASVVSSKINVTGPESQGYNDPLIYIYNVEKFALPQSDWETIKSNPYNQVRFIDDATGRYWNVWPKEVSYDYETQTVTKGEFIGRSPLNLDQDLCWVLEKGFWNDDCYWNDNKTWID